MCSYCALPDHPAAVCSSSVIALDNVLTPEALKKMQDFCLGSNVFHQQKTLGYVGSQLDDGGARTAIDLLLTCYWVTIDLLLTYYWLTIDLLLTFTFLRALTVLCSLCSLYSFSAHSDHCIPLLAPKGGVGV